MVKKTAPSAVATGFVSGNETVFAYSDDDVVRSEVKLGRTVRGW